MPPATREERIVPAGIALHRLVWNRLGWPWVGCAGQRSHGTGGAQGQRTLSSPFMFVCSEQMNGYVPAGSFSTPLTGLVDPPLV